MFLLGNCGSWVMMCADRLTGGSVLALVQMDHEDLVRLANDADGFTGSVGPTSESGLTAVWYGGADAWLATLTGAFFTELDDHGTHVRVRSSTGEVVECLLPEDDDPRASVVASRLARLLGEPARAQDVHAVLSESGGWPVDLAYDLADSFELPLLDRTATSQSVVVVVGDDDTARMMSHVNGPVYFRQLGKWSVARGESHAVQLEIARSLGAAGRRSARVLVLWRNADGACGVFTQSRKATHPRLGLTWNGWTMFPHEAPDADTVRTLAREVGAPDADLTTLRTLCATTTWADDPLAALVRALRLPPHVLVALDPAADLQGFERLKKHGAVRAVVSNTWTGDGRPNWTPRWIRLLLAWLTLLLSLAYGWRTAWNLTYAVTHAGAPGAWSRAGLDATVLTILVLGALSSFRRARRPPDPYAP